MGDGRWEMGDGAAVYQFCCDFATEEGNQTEAGAGQSQERIPPDIGHIRLRMHKSREYDSSLCNENPGTRRIQQLPNLERPRITGTLTDGMPSASDAIFRVGRASSQFSLRPHIILWS